MKVIHAASDDRTLLTQAEVAEILRVSTETVKDWRLRPERYRGSRPPYIKLGRIIRYRKAALAAWLARYEKRSGGENGKRA